MKEQIDYLIEEIEAIKPNSNYAINIIQEILESGGEYIDAIEAKYHIDICVSTEKHHVLQVTHYYELHSSFFDVELSLEIEDGISNGTELRSYSFENSVMPSSREVEVLEDVELDVSMYSDKFHLAKARAVFPRYREVIIKLLRNQSYDNYVTGGGTNKTNEYYRNKMKEIKDFGLFWTPIYKTIQADLNLI